MQKAGGHEEKLLGLSFTSKKTFLPPTIQCRVEGDLHQRNILLGILDNLFAVFLLLNLLLRCYGASLVEINSGQSNFDTSCQEGNKS